MANATWLFRNRLLDGSILAGAEVSGLGAGNIQKPLGSAAEAWQTPFGVLTPAAGAWLLGDAGVITTWRAFLLARTNLSSGAQVRWRVGTAEALVEATPGLDLVYDGAWQAPVGYAVARASKAWAWDADGNLIEYAANVARIAYDSASRDLIGLLIEPARQNDVRNPRGEGVVAGTPGTAPTNWNLPSSGSGLSREMLSSVTQGGIVYTRVRYSGTASASTALVLLLEAAANITVAASDVRSSSLMLGRVIASGATPTLALSNREFAADGTTVTVADSSPPTVNPGATPIPVVRTTTMGVSTLRLAPCLRVGIVNGQSYDFTLWIGVPQAELGAFATTPILPDIGSPGASTRAAETHTLIDAVDIGARQGVLAAEMEVIATESGTNSTPIFICDDTASVQNRAGFLVTATTVVSRPGVGGSFSTLSPTYTFTAGTPFTIAASYGSAGHRQASSLGASGAAALGEPTADIDTLRITSLSTAGQSAAYALRRLRVYPTRLSDAQLDALGQTGSSMTAAGLAYDSGTIDANVWPDVGQSLHIAPAEVSGRYCRVDLWDAGNPDGFVNIPLAYAGDMWEMTINVAPGTETDPERTIPGLRTRHGQEHVQYQWRQRAWRVVMDSVTEAEYFDQMLALDLTATRGINVGFVFDHESPYAAREAVFGLLRSESGMPFPWETTEYRAWRARVSERL